MPCPKFKCTVIVGSRWIFLERSCNDSSGDSSRHDRNVAVVAAARRTMKISDVVVPPHLLAILELLNCWGVDSHFQRKREQEAVSKSRIELPA